VVAIAVEAVVQAAIAAVAAHAQLVALVVAQAAEEDKVKIEI
jgi:hypothetical protein